MSKIITDAKDPMTPKQKSKVLEPEELPPF